MKVSILLFSLLLMANNLVAIVDSLAIKYENLIDNSSLKIKLTVLSHDSLLGRETAQLGQEKAERFIVSEFTKYGISPANKGSYIQTFSVIKNEFNHSKFQFRDTEIDSDTEFFNTSLIKDTILTANSLIYAGYGISTPAYNDYESLEVLDKLVFVREGIPDEDYSLSILSGDDALKWNINKRLKIINAQENGAKGIVFIVEDLIEFKRQFGRVLKQRDVALYDETQAGELPVFYVSENVFYSLFQIRKNDILKYGEKVIKSKKRKSIESIGVLSIDVKCNRYINESSNVLAEITCSDTSAPWIVLSAHYDHEGIKGDEVYNGADDNASGTSAVIELGKVFMQAKDDGVIFHKNILLLLVSGEEKGLLGSKYYVSKPVVALDETMVNLNIDMIGRVDRKHEADENYVYVIGSDRISQDLHDINEEMNQDYTHLELDYTFNALDDPHQFYSRSDHYNFAKNGIPIIFYFNGTHKDYHKVSDTEDKINYPLFIKRTKLVFHTAWYMARMDGLLTK